MTFEQETQPRKNVFGPVSEIGQGAVLDLALVTEGLAQENARGRIAVGAVSIYMATNILINARTKQRNNAQITWLRFEA